MKEGDRFGRWTVLDISGAARVNSYQVLCMCDCGTVRSTQKKYLKKGLSKSCGCQGVYVGAELSSGTVVSVIKTKFTDIKVRCKCGSEFQSRYAKGGTRSQCPNCRVHKRVHGESGVNSTPEYRSWKAMMYRCNPNGSHYYTVERGITVCERWHTYENFLADMGRRPDPRGRAFSIERVDNEGDYEPGNCVWATPTAQMNNRRPYEMWKRKA